MATAAEGAAVTGERNVLRRRIRFTGRESFKVA
jgi:hypothetical protein